MKHELEKLRTQIDTIDNELLETLAKRVEIVKAIGEYKRANGIPPLDQTRWQQVMDSRCAKAHELSLSKPFVQQLYELIHKYSLQIESEK